MDQNGGSESSQKRRPRESKSPLKWKDEQSSVIKRYTNSQIHLQLKIMVGSIDLRLQAEMMQNLHYRKLKIIEYMIFLQNLASNTSNI